MDGVTITVGAAGLVAVGGVAVKLLDLYLSRRNGRANGNVKREECHLAMGKIETRFDKTDTRIGELHEKVNDSNTKLAEMKGFLEAHLG